MREEIKLKNRTIRTNHLLTLDELLLTYKEIEKC